MARRILLRTGGSVEEVERRYRVAKDPHERAQWQIAWVLTRSRMAKEMAESTDYSRYRIGQIANRYHAEGAEGSTVDVRRSIPQRTARKNRRYTSCAQPSLPAASLHKEHNK